MEMEVIIFEAETYWKMQKQLMELFSSTLRKVQEEKNSDVDEWLSWDEAKKILGYKSKRQWQLLRDKGLIVYSQSGRKISYSKKSLLEFLQRNVK